MTVTKLLLVEDEEPVREMLKFALGDEEYEILEAFSLRKSARTLKASRHG